MFDNDLITGTLIHYYATCKREAWLYSRKIHADQHDENEPLMMRFTWDLKRLKLASCPKNWSYLSFVPMGFEMYYFYIGRYFYISEH